MLRDRRDAPTMRDTEFRMLADMLREHCGLHFGPDSRYLLERRLATRIAELGLRSFMAYHYVLRNDPDGHREIDRAVELLTTNETYFFRERGQLLAIVEQVIPERRAWRSERGLGPVPIWSAGCSSGEEPYSIVMLALEAGLEPGRDFRVYASDISRSTLHKARSGQYGAGSFRETEPFLRKRYFHEKHGTFRIADEVKKQITFTHMNLLDRSRSALLGMMDVVVCRNVIIYFDLETKRRVIRAFHEKLEPGGYLALGHAESLINLSNDFELCHLAREMLYRKPATGESPSERWHVVAQAALAAAGRESS